MFYNAAVFEKLIHRDGSINNEVYCAITGDDADLQVSGHFLIVKEGDISK